MAKRKKNKKKGRGNSGFKYVNLNSYYVGVVGGKYFEFKSWEKAKKKFFNAKKVRHCAGITRDDALLKLRTLIDLRKVQNAPVFFGRFMGKRWEKLSDEDLAWIIDSTDDRLIGEKALDILMQRHGDLELHDFYQTTVSR